MSAKLSIMVLSATIDGEAVTTYEHDFDQRLYGLLPNLYVVLISKGVSGPRDIAGALFMKTTLHHDETAEDFRDAINAGIRASQPLRHLASLPIRLLPAKLTLAGTRPISEGECLRVIADQLLKFRPAAGRS